MSLDWVEVAYKVFHVDVHIQKMPGLELKLYEIIQIVSEDRQTQKENVFEHKNNGTPMG